jgi:hypothetical protein
MKIACCKPAKKSEIMRFRADFEKCDTSQAKAGQQSNAGRDLDRPSGHEPAKYSIEKCPEKGE